jgi:ABC-type bacteriocin/lantibiotic exporter with double-glycine peptidase domain
VIPSFSLVRATGFIFLPFINKNVKTFLAVKQIAELCDSAKKMIQRLNDYPYGLSAQKQINDFLAQPERNDIQKNILIAEPIASLRLFQVSFGYEKNKLVLNKLDLEFRRGEINYLRGANGFGKSTIISLIMGLYSPESGEILVDNNYKLRDLNLVEWRKKIAYAEHQNLIENGLSTGQKQLVDIETTLAQHSHKEIFIFDEADNSLDETNKKAVRRQLEEVAKNKLVILISH